MAIVDSRSVKTVEKPAGRKGYEAHIRGYDVHNTSREENVAFFGGYPGAATIYRGGDDPVAAQASRPSSVGSREEP